MAGTGRTGNSRKTIAAIIAIAVGAIAVIAAIVAIALGGFGAKEAPGSNGAVFANVEDSAGTENATASTQAQEERIVGHWSNAGSGGGFTTLLSGIAVEANGTAHRFENGTQGADYRWEARDDGTYVFTDYYELDGSETVVTIDDNDRLHWGERVFSRDEQPENPDADASSQEADAQPAGEQDVVGKWYYDIDPTGSGGAGRPMYYALDVVEDGTATLTYNGMSHAEYSWTANGDGFDFAKTGGEGSAGYADSAHAYLVENGGLEWNGNGSGMLFVRTG